MVSDKRRQRGLAERLATTTTRFTGSSAAFLVALGIIVAWLLTGPVFQYSDTWQLVINTGTTIVTFLMVFLIQRNQNKEALALQLKVNELVAAVQGASNRLVNVEDLSERGWPPSTPTIDGSGKWPSSTSTSSSRTRSKRPKPATRTSSELARTGDGDRAARPGLRASSLPPGVDWPPVQRGHPATRQGRPDTKELPISQPSARTARRKARPGGKGQACKLERSKRA